MKYYWLSPKDQRPFNWIFHHLNEENFYVLREEYAKKGCKNCGKFDEIKALKEFVPTDVKIKSRYDFLSTDDGLICVSTKLKSFMEDVGIRGVEYLPLPGDNRYFILLPEKEIETNIATCGMEFYAPCTECDRFEETCLFPRSSSMKLPEDSRWLIYSSIKLEKSRTQGFWYLASEEVFNLLKENKISGIDYYADEARK